MSVSKTRKRNCKSYHEKSLIKQLIVFWKVGAKFKLVAQAQRNGFKVEGPWNADKYCRLPWLAEQKNA